MLFELKRKALDAGMELSMVLNLELSAAVLCQHSLHNSLDIETLQQSNHSFTVAFFICEQISGLAGKLLFSRLLTSASAHKTWAEYRNNNT